MSARVFIQRRDGREEGPYSEEEVLDLLDSGQLSPRDWCRVNDQPHAQTIGEVFEIIAPEPPSSPRKTTAPHTPRRVSPQARDEEENADADAEEDTDEDEDDDTQSDDARHRVEANPNLDDEDAEVIGKRERDDLPEDDGYENEDEEEENEDAADGEDDDFEKPFPEEETLVYRGSPSLLAYGSPLAFIVLVLAAGYWAGAFGAKWVMASVAISLLLLVRLLLHRAAREYMVTTERVEASHGLLSKDTRQILLRDLSAIRVIRRWPLSWLGVGTIIFSADAGPEDDVVFERVGRARRVIALARAWQQCQPR